MEEIINEEITNEKENINEAKIDETHVIETPTEPQPPEIETGPGKEKRGRGRPRKQKNNNELKNEAKIDFQTDFNLFNETKITEPDENEEINIEEAIDIKASLLFIDGLMVTIISKIFKKNIEAMNEDEAAFLASLAPGDLQLLKPSKTTFFTALIIYYLTKIF